MKCTAQVWLVVAGSMLLPAVVRGQEAQDANLNWELAHQVPAEDVFAIRFHPVQDNVFAADSSRSVATVWEMGKRVPVFTVPHGELVADLAWSPDGNLLATASYDGTVRMTRFPSGETVASFSHPGQVLRLAFSHSGEFLATILNGGDCALRVWHVSTGLLMTQVPCDLPLAGRPDFSRDDKLVAAGGGQRNQGRVVVAVFQEDPRLAAFQAVAEPLAPVSTSSPRIRQAPRPPSGQWSHLGTLKDFSWGIQWLKFVPGSHQLVVGGTTDSTVQVRNLDNVRGSGFLPIPEGVKKSRHSAILPVLSLVVSPDGTCIASSCTRGVWAWRSTSPRQPLQAFLVGKKEVHDDMAFSPDSKYLLTLNGVLWDMKDAETPGRMVTHLSGWENGPTTAAFSRSGRYIALGSKHDIKVWDNPDYEVVETAAVERVRK